MYKDNTNNNNETTRQIITRTHKVLTSAGEKWMKENASSSNIVGALIITIMFTAAFAIPGGNNQEIDIPILPQEKAIKIFMISDSISLFATSTYVLMFLGIITSRYAEADFLWSLSTKLVIGLSTLFISIAAMMVMFCATKMIAIDKRLEYVVLIILLASVPVSLFTLLEFPLLVQNFRCVEADLLWSLPTKLMIRLLTLFISIAAMMVTFCATEMIAIDKRLEYVVPIILLVSVPVSLFTLLDFPLLVQNFRCVEADLLWSLPTKLMIRLLTLFISIAAMMVTFCATEMIAIDKRLEYVVPIILLVSVPVSLFTLLDFPLLVQNFRCVEADLLWSLPTKLMIRLLTLFISIAAMMVTFCATEMIAIDKRLEYVVPIILLVSVPVSLFVAGLSSSCSEFQETGIPILLHEKAIKIFMISDSISLFAASTYVLMFLGILTSRCVEADLLKSLPTKLMIRLLTLFISIASMMVTFFATEMIAIDKRLEYVVPIILLVSVPVSLFTLLDFPLLVQNFRYAEADFLWSLPTKLVIGLSTLFISIAAMMVTFCATVMIAMDKRLEYVVLIILLESVPVSLFTLLQFPLLVQNFRQIITRTHKILASVGEKWMKENASSSNIVGALIFTIMFTAAFAIPGGNNQEIGIPILLHEKAIKIFMISDSISLFAASTFVLMFFGILTSRFAEADFLWSLPTKLVIRLSTLFISIAAMMVTFCTRYAEADFLWSLPTKLVIGLSTLFISIAAMMVTFCATVMIAMDKRLEYVVLIILLESVPVSLFTLLQFPLLVQNFRQIITRTHKILASVGEKWMKENASSSNIVGALIFTIMFTAAFAIPGGNNQEIGIPILLHEKAIKIFMISDSISLFAASTFVLMFFGILTSRFAEADFLWSLPTKLVIRLSTLFISIAAMMVTFCTT
ncbi:hypothetical protein LINPERHAP2_LOCUS925 [Linum perenne]